MIRCNGRIAAGAEVNALQAELEKQTKIPGMKLLVVKKVILQLAGTDFTDSSGLGALVRMLGVLRAEGGDLKLPFVQKVLEVTNLLSVFFTYASESEAISAFSAGRRYAQAGTGSSRTRTVCVDSSGDLLRKSAPEVRIRQLPPDFSTADAGEAGVHLADNLQALFAV